LLRKDEYGSLTRRVSTPRLSAPARIAQRGQRESHFERSRRYETCDGAERHQERAEEDDRFATGSVGRDATRSAYGKAHPGTATEIGRIADDQQTHSAMTTSDRKLRAPQAKQERTKASAAIAEAHRPRQLIWTEQTGEREKDKKVYPQFRHKPVADGNQTAVPASRFQIQASDR